MLEFHHAIIRAACMFIMFITPLAHSQEQAVNNGKRLFANCSSCHSLEPAIKNSPIASLMNQSRDVLVMKMLEYKAGSRQGTIMHQLAKGYTEEEIQSIASYIVSKK